MSQQLLPWTHYRELIRVEKTLEGRLALHMQRFIMELGKGFAFIGRQQHVHTDIDEYYIDLKTHQITHQDVGQMDR